MSENMNIIVITGASSGIGEEFLRQYDQMIRYKCEFWLIGRNTDKLYALTKELLNPCRIFAYDLSGEEWIEDWNQVLKKNQPSVRLLINSAGYGLSGIFSDLDLKEQSGCIDLNCRALTQMTYTCIPYMSRNARMIQMASSAAFLPQPGFAVYAASKAYVMSFARALKRELKKKNISITIVCPGPVDTPFFTRGNNHAATGSLKRIAMKKPAAVVKQAIRDAGKRREFSICGGMMQNVFILSKIIPHAFLMTLMKICTGRK